MATKHEKNYMARVARLGCILCSTVLGYEDSPAVFITLEGLVSVLQAPLSPSVLYITEETMGFTDWVEKVLKESGIPQRKRYYRESNKAWEIKAQVGLQSPIL